MGKIAELGLETGQQIHLVAPLRRGTAHLVDIIPAGLKPKEEDIQQWYAPLPPKRAFEPIRVDRFVFQRDDSLTFVVIPDSDLQSVTRCGIAELHRPKGDSDA